MPTTQTVKVVLMEAIRQRERMVALHWDTFKRAHQAIGKAVADPAHVNQPDTLYRIDRLFELAAGADLKRRRYEEEAAELRQAVQQLTAEPGHQVPVIVASDAMPRDRVAFVDVKTPSIFDKR